MNKKRDEKNSLFVLVSVALLLAIQVVLSRFLSIQTLSIKIGFGFIPVVIAARRFGPVASMTVNGLGDIIGAILFPKGAYFPGYTLTAALVGLIFGLYLYKKISFPRICLSVLTTQVVGSLLLNSLWISIQFGSDYKALLATRSIQCLVMAVVQIVFMQFVLEKLCNVIKIPKKTVKAE